MSNVINKITGQYKKSVHTPDYTGNDDYIINPTQAEIDQYTPQQTFEQRQAILIGEIVAKGDSLISQGFDYNGYIFSASDANQTNFNSYRLEAIEDPDPDKNLFPIEWTLANGDGFVIDDKNIFKAIFKQGLDSKKDILKDSRKLIKDVKQATTEGQLDAIRTENNNRV